MSNKNYSNNMQQIDSRLQKLEETMGLISTNVQDIQSALATFAQSKNDLNEAPPVRKTGQIIFRANNNSSSMEENTKNKSSVSKDMCIEALSKCYRSELTAEEAYSHIRDICVFSRL
ncbi:hypothetical protein [Parasitella parasitica]|uniref:Uncharacterized protein n=1 Tax=Parasitella parasitica TaxID=35722 RepID=A0A0B7N9X3_9FUNG|nr:hypothetical protein [Parasitella parasitica]